MNINSKGSRMTRKEREFQSRRREIVTAAVRLFAVKGYHNTAMNEIAREAEFSTGSLYNFFKNKEELYFTVVREQLEELTAKLADESALEGTAFGKIERMVDTILNYFEGNRDFFRIMVTYRDTFEWSIKGEFSEVIYNLQLAFIQDIIDVFKQGIKDEVFKPYAAEELAFLFLSVMSSVISIYVNSEVDYSLKDRRDVILDLFYNGAGK